MAEYTLTYDSGSQGWVSFYSYFPEKIIGMNNYLYTLKGGNLWQHNTNPNRNTFYGSFNPNTDSSYVTSVVNQSPLVNKVFKAFYLESDDSWESSFVTDKITGFIEKDFYEKKESDYFAFIRTRQLPAAGSGSTYNTIPSLQLRSVIGIGEVSLTTIISPTEWRLRFPAGTELNPVFIESRDNDPASPSFGQGGDVIYDFAGVPNPRPIGQVIEINQATNEIYVDPTGYALIAPFNGDLLFSVKNSVFESNGLLGHYLQFTITNDTQDPVELFAVGTDAMISEPAPRQK